MYLGKKGILVLLIALSLFLVLFSVGFLKSGITGAITAEDNSTLNYTLLIESPHSELPAEEQALGFPFDTEEETIIPEDVSPPPMDQPIKYQDNCGGGVACHCGDTATGDVELTTDLGGSCDGVNGINVGANNIIINCSGYAINGSGTDTNSYGIYASNRNNITIKNCNITNFDYGIYFSKTGNSSIINNTIHENSVSTGSSGIYSTGGANIIQNNTIYQNPYGITLYNNNNTLVDNNNVSFSSSTGIYCTGNAGFYNNSVTNNDVMYSAGSGFGPAAIYNCNYIDSNFIYNSTTTAIYTSNAANVSRNVIVSNGPYQGIDIGSTSNHNITHNTLTNLVNLSSGIEVSSLVFNNTIVGYNNSIFFSTSSTNNQILNNNLSGAITGIALSYGSSENIFSNNIISNNNYGISFGSVFNTYAASVGIYYSFSSANNIFSNEILRNNLIDIYAPNGTELNTFINVSYTNLSIMSNSTLLFKQLVTLNISDGNGLPILNANISIYNNSGGLEISDYTNKDGLVTINVTDFIINGYYSGAIRTYAGNHTFNLTLGGATNSTSINVSLTNSTLISLSLNLNRSTCGLINRSVTILNHLNITDSCFLINSSDITIDGNGASIFSNGSGLGINVTNFNNITLKHLYLTNFGTAAQFTNSSNNTLTDNHFNNSQIGLELIRTNHSLIRSNYIQNNSNNGTLFSNSYFNIVYNNYISGNHNSSWDNGTNSWNSSLDCTKTNIIGQSCWGGNYWSDFIGNDSNLDGIGDERYNITWGGNNDSLVLAKFPTYGCGEINASTQLIPGVVYSTTGNCFTIPSTANNITINGRNAIIKGDWDGGLDYGIFVSATNVTIQNLVIEGFALGIYAIGSNVTISNVTFKDVAGIYSANSYCNLSNNYIHVFNPSSSFNTFGTGSLPVGINNRGAGSVISNNLINYSAYANFGVGVYLSTYSDNIISTNNISCVSHTSLTNDFYTNSDGTNYLINNTFANNNISTASSTTLYVQWYVDVNVTDQNSLPIPNATIVGYRSDLAVDDSDLTNANGLVRLALTEYFHQSGTKYVATPPTYIKVTKNGYTQNLSSTFTINSSRSLTLLMVVAVLTSTKKILLSMAWATLSMAPELVLA